METELGGCAKVECGHALTSNHPKIFSQAASLFSECMHLKINYIVWIKKQWVFIIYGKKLKQQHCAHAWRKKFRAQELTFALCLLCSHTHHPKLCRQCITKCHISCENSLSRRDDRGIQYCPSQVCCLQVLKVEIRVKGETTKLPLCRSCNHGKIAGGGLG